MLTEFSSAYLIDDQLPKPVIIVVDFDLSFYLLAPTSPDGCTRRILIDLLLQMADDVAPKYVQVVYKLEQSFIGFPSPPVYRR